MGVQGDEAPPKLKIFQLIDTQRRGKSAMFLIFWTRCSAIVGGLARRFDLLSNSGMAEACLSRFTIKSGMAWAMPRR